MKSFFLIGLILNYHVFANEIVRIEMKVKIQKGNNEEVKTAIINTKYNNHFFYNNDDLSFDFLVKKYISQTKELKKNNIISLYGKIFQNSPTDKKKLILSSTVFTPLGEEAIISKESVDSFIELRIKAASL